MSPVVLYEKKRLCFGWGYGLVWWGERKREILPIIFVVWWGTSGPLCLGIVLGWFLFPVVFSLSIYMETVWPSNLVLLQRGNLFSLNFSCCCWGQEIFKVFWIVHYFATRNVCYVFLCNRDMAFALLLCSIYLPLKYCRSVLIIELPIHS